MARIPKKPKPRRGRQPTCYVCKKIATIKWTDEDTVEHYAVARFFPEIREFRMVVVCSEECAAQIHAERDTSAIRDLRRSIARESPLVMTLTMMRLYGKSEGGP